MNVQMETIGHDAKGLGEAFDGKPSLGVIHLLRREGCVHERRQRGGRAHEMIVVADQVIGERADLRSEGCSKQTDNPIFWNIATNNE